MAVASLVLGIISFVIGVFPVIGTIAFLPAVIGLILGIVDLVNSNKKTEGNEIEEAQKSKRGFSIAGTILSGITIFVVLFWNIMLVKATGLFFNFITDTVEAQFGKNIEEITEEDVNEFADKVENYLEEQLDKFAD